MQDADRPKHSSSLEEQQPIMNDAVQTSECCILLPSELMGHLGGVL